MRKPNPRYMHVAALLRSIMDRNEWKVADVNIALGYERYASTIYPWLNGTSVPSDDKRKAVAKLFKVSESELMAKDNVTLLHKPKSTALVVVPTPKPVIPDPLTFVVSANGQARIKLDVTMPLETATPLLRMLLDAGIVFTVKEP